MSIIRETFGLSFEFFPPQSLEASFKLWTAVDALAGFAPEFVSVTYGAGGSTRELTKSAAMVIRENYGLEVAGHLTCVNASRAEVLDVARGYAESGVKQIVALRGDAPNGADSFSAHPDGFVSSVELISALADMNQFNIRVGAYPHKHPDASDEHADIEYLKRKFEAGADSAITQFFFEAEDFLRFRDRCDKAGIRNKITPGILPIENWEKTKKFAARCGTVTPDWMDKAYSNTESPEQARLLSTVICTEICDDLLCEGVEDLHFYTLNDPTLTQDVCRALGRKLITLALHKVA